MINREFADLPEEVRNTLPKSEKVYRSKPTPECPKGSRGRTAVFEVLTMTQDLETAILKNASESELWGIARRHGMLTMKEDAILKAYERIIPIEEVSTLGGVLDE